jgi:hypothetical protein
MNSLNKLLLLTTTVLMGSSAYADIYEWTDENGVKHFTNYSPPDQARIIMKTEEVPYDEAADRARTEMERLASLELARLEIAEREAEVERREAEAEQRLAEANRQAEETLRQAEDLLETAGSYRHSYSSGYAYPYYPYTSYYNPYGSYYNYRYSPYHKKSYFDINHRSHYFKKPHQKFHYKDRGQNRHFSAHQPEFHPKASLRPGRFSLNTGFSKGHFESKAGRNFGGRQFGSRGYGFQK